MRKRRIQFTTPLFSLVSIVVIASLSLLSINNHGLKKEYEERQARIDAMIDAYYDSLKTEPVVPQDFLQKYRTLSEKNIDDFFKDWKQWSDKMREYSTNDSYNALFNQVYEHYPFFKEADTTEFISLPSNIEVRYYSTEYDKLDWGMAVIRRRSFPKVTKGETFIPSLYGSASLRTLYLTHQIDSLLTEYLGVDELINEEREKEIGRRIQTHYGHWGGYWWLTSMPTIYGFHYTTDGILVIARTGFASGDYLFYPNGHYEEVTEISGWIE